MPSAQSARLCEPFELFEVPAALAMTFLPARTPLMSTGSGTVLAVALRDGSPVDLALVVALAAGIASGVLALAVEGVQGFAISPQELAIIAFGAVGSGAVPTLVRAWSLPEIGPPVVGALGVLAPVMTVLLSMALLGTGRSPLAVVGVFVIAVGAVVAALAPMVSARRRA